MTRSVELLGGSVLGLILGTVFLATPIASAVASSARATWSLAGCPPGVYTLVSTAVLLGGGPVHNATTSVRVPQADVVQVFNVPPGQYAVTGILQHTTGVVGSGVQVVNTDEGGGFVALRSRAPSQPVKGTAGLRRPQAPPSTPAVSAPAPAVTTAAFKPLAPTAAPRPVSGSAGPREWLLAELVRLSDPEGSESGWHQVQLVDVDGDGQVDEIRIEPPNGTSVVWRLVPQRLPVRTP
jgi:hypothetical protein